MNFVTTIQADSIVIRVPPRFDFRFMGEFRIHMETAIDDGQGSELVVDLSDTTYVDSSAMGMLLVLRDRARAKGKYVVIARAEGVVKTALQRAKFEQIFDFR